MIELSEHQNDAIKVIRKCIIEDKQPLTKLMGYAGTGKSTLLPFLLDAIGYNPHEVYFAAPTGKAALVMKNKLEAYGYPNTNASTIHKAIYKPHPDNVYELEKQIARTRVDKSIEPALRDKKIAQLKTELEASYQGKDIGFQLNVDSPLQGCKLIVIDEASMVGLELAGDLFYFEVPILAIGDPGQLPPVNDVPGLTSGKADFTLTEIHRQAKDNPIIWLSTQIRERKPLKIGKIGDSVNIMRRVDFDFNDLPIQRPQFIVGTNKTRWNVTKQLRKKYINANTIIGPRKGEPLIVCKNSKQHTDLVNGAEVTGLDDINLVAGTANFSMKFETNNELYNTKVFQGHFEEHITLKVGEFTCGSRNAWKARKNSVELDWAYAITCHKAQGSQWDSVFVIDEGSVFQEDEYKWRYTGATRASKYLTILI